MNIDHSKCCFSTGICGNITAGQGKLDDNGYWEIPCYECIRKANTKTATQDQIATALKKAEAFMKDRGNTLYNSVQSTATIAIVDYILYTHGLVRNGK